MSGRARPLASLLILPQITVGSAGASPWDALWELGRVSQLHRTDRLSSAVHDHCDKGSGEGKAPDLEIVGNLGDLILLAAILVLPD